MRSSLHSCRSRSPPHLGARDLSQLLGIDHRDDAVANLYGTPPAQLAHRDNDRFAGGDDHGGQFLLGKAQPDRDRLRDVGPQFGGAFGNLFGKEQ